MLASNLGEQGLKEQDIAFDLNEMSKSLDGQEFTNTLKDVKDLDSYVANATKFVDDVSGDQLELIKYQTEVADLQTQIDAQRQLDLAAAEKTGVPLEDWYKQYGKEEFIRENEARTKLADANARFQESQLDYINELSGQAQQYLDGWDKIKDTVKGKEGLETITNLRKMLNDASAGTDSVFGQALNNLRDASKGTRTLIEDADRYQGQLPTSGEEPPTPYEQSKLFRKLNIEDSAGAIKEIDRGIKDFTGKEGAIQQLISRLRDEEKRLKEEGDKAPSEPFLPNE